MMEGKSGASKNTISIVFCPNLAHFSVINCNFLKRNERYQPCHQSIFFYIPEAWYSIMIVLHLLTIFFLKFKNILEQKEN